MLQPTVNSQNNSEWIELIGKYIVNMGAIETTSRLIIANINNSDTVAIYKGALAKRLDYLKARYSKADVEKHNEAMAFFDVLSKHVSFRNIIAHSGIFNQKNEKGEIIPIGLMNFTPDDPEKIGEIISLEELRGRVNESASLGVKLLELQNDFSL